MNVTPLSRNIKNFSSHGITYALGSSLNALMAFFLIPLYTKHLEPSDYGVLGLLLVISNFSRMIVLSGGGAAMMRSFYDYTSPEKQKVVISTTYFWIFLSALAWLFIGALTTEYISKILFQTPKYSILIIGAISVGAAQALKTIPQNIFRIYKLSRLYITLEAGTFIVSVITIVYLVAGMGMGLNGIILGLFVSGLLSVIVLTLFIAKDIVFKIDYEELKKQMRFGYPLIFAGLNAMVFNFSGRFFIQYYHTLELVGIFTLAQQVAGILNKVYYNPLKMIWAPVYYENYKSQSGERLFKYLTDYTLFISFSLSLAIALFSRELLLLFTSAKYIEASSIIPIMVSGVAFWVTSPMFNRGVVIKRETKFMAANFFLGAVVNIILNALFVPRWEIQGAATAMTISYIIMFTDIIVYNYKLNAIYIHLKRNIQLFSIIIIAFLCSLIYTPTTLSYAIIYKLGLFISAYIILYLTGYLTKDERIYLNARRTDRK